MKRRVHREATELPGLQSTHYRRITCLGPDNAAVAEVESSLDRRFHEITTRIVGRLIGWLSDRPGQRNMTCNHWCCPKSFGHG